MSLPLWVMAQNNDIHYKIYDVKKQKIASLQELMVNAVNVDVIFFGEEHNDSIAHDLQLKLLAGLAEVYGNKIGLTLEIFSTDVQPIINEYLAGLISEKSFIKEARAWNNYKDYRPLIEFAKREGISVIGANAAARYSNAVTKGGLAILSTLPSHAKKSLPPARIDTLAGRYYDKFIDLLGGHSMGGMKVFQTQNFWDATMAWSIAKFAWQNQGFKILQINGRFHSDEKLGTFAQLFKYAPKLKALSISAFAADDFKAPNWKNYEILADYIIITDPTVKKTF